MLQSMGSQRVAYDLATEQQQASKKKVAPDLPHGTPKDLFFTTDFLITWAPKLLWTMNAATKLKKRLLSGRKAMTNLDSTFKSRDITLLTKVCIVKSSIFPVVIYGCESWTIKKAER